MDVKRNTICAWLKQGRLTPSIFEGSVQKASIRHGGKGFIAENMKKRVRAYAGGEGVRASAQFRYSVLMVHKGGAKATA